MHGVYAAFFEFRDSVLIKIGRSSRPYRRLQQVTAGSPFELTQAVFCHVGGLAAASSIEARAAHKLAKYRTRGEWYLFDRSEGRIFNELFNVAYSEVTGRPLKWTKVDPDILRRESREAFMKGRFGKEAAA